MITKKEYLAKVIDNIDPLKQGRAKIRISDLHWGIVDDDLPWARQDKEFSSMTPEIGDILNVYCVDNFYKKWFYKCSLSLENKHKHNDFENNVKSNIGSNSSYPNTKYLIFPNNVCIAFDSSAGNPEISLYSPKETWLYIDKDGNMNLKANNKFSIKTDSSDLKTLLEKIIDTIVAMKTVGTPALHTVHPQDQATLNSIKSTEIANLLK